MHGAASSVIVIAALIIFSLVRRIRRTIGFQRFRRGSLITRLVIFILLGALFVYVGILEPKALISDLCGAIIGAVLVVVATRTTIFESRQGVWFYRPNPWIGAMLVVLFIGRIAYRYIAMLPVYSHLGTENQAALQQSQSLSTYSRDPWTAGVFFILIAYYIGYNWFIIRRERQLEHPQPEDALGQ